MQQIQNSGSGSSRSARVACKEGGCTYHPALLYESAGPLQVVALLSTHSASKYTALSTAILLRHAAIAGLYRLGIEVWSGDSHLLFRANDRWNRRIRPANHEHCVKCCRPALCTTHRRNSSGVVYTCHAGRQCLHRIGRKVLAITTPSLDA